MLALTLFGIFFALALAGVPLVYAILISTVGTIWFESLPHPLEGIFLSFIGGVEPFILLAIPLFIFAGELLVQGGVGKRLVEFCRVLIGWLPGGLGVVTVVSCTLFGGVSGAAIADTAAIGSLTIPAMVARGYSRGFSAALLAVAGTLALLMPLSIPFLVYAFISGVSMRDLSMAGLLPALALALALIAMCIWYGKRSGCDVGGARSTPAQIWAAARDAGPALIMPIIIVGGIWLGVFTPSESAAVAVMYGLAISLVYYKELSWRSIPQMLLNAFMTSATVMLVIGATGAMAWLITVEQLAVHMADWIEMVSTEPWIFLLCFSTCLLLLGIFIEPLPAMLLSGPLLLPLARECGMDMVHIGVVMTATLSMALYTPPVGGTLFVAAKLAKAGMGEVTAALWPLMAAALAILVLVMFFPQASLWLPGLIRSL